MGVSLLGVIGAPLVMMVVATGFRQHGGETYDAAVFCMTRVMLLLYIGLISLVALASGILNTWRRFRHARLHAGAAQSRLDRSRAVRRPACAGAADLRAGLGVLVGGILQLAVRFRRSGGWA
ncbi:lipid II flippase MurJ [Cupriavidus basilensis]